MSSLCIILPHFAGFAFLIRLAHKFGILPTKDNLAGRVPDYSRCRLECGRGKFMGSHLTVVGVATPQAPAGALRRFRSPSENLTPPSVFPDCSLRFSPRKKLNGSKPMNEFHAMKGEGKQLLVFHRASRVITLVRYCDDSLGIICGGDTLAVYEPGEEDACIAALAVLAGLKKGKPAIVVKSRQLRIRSLDKPSQN
jgi:hypothetical protein